MAEVLNQHILVTGASGFIGRHLCRHLFALGAKVRAVVRVANVDLCADEVVICEALEDVTDWSNLLQDIDCVIHLAARVHVMNEYEKDPLAEFRRINVTTAERLGKGMVNAGVKRLIFLSSVKVNGEITKEHPFTSEDHVAPVEPYALSKWEAERSLLKLSDESGLEVVIIRPPLVYGPGVKGNFLRLLKLVESGVPLPFSGIDNRRSMVSVFNLCDFIVVCVQRSGISNEIFLVSDDQPLSITELLKGIAKHMNHKAKLFKISRRILMLAGVLTGKNAEISRLLDSLEVSIEKNNQLLGWNPPIPIDEGLRKTVEWYCKSQDKC